MTAAELISAFDLRVCSDVPEAKLLDPVSGVIACDMMSEVLARGDAAMLWVTVQTHLNVVALARFLDLSMVLVPYGLPVPEETAGRASTEGVLVCRTEMSAYELCGKLYALGVGKPH